MYLEIYKPSVRANASGNHRHAGCTFALQRDAKHSSASRNAGRPSGQKSTLSDLMEFLKFIQLGSQVYNGAVESGSHASIGAN